ncbi:MAG TPA: AAA family ATPase, partial [Candidatus Bathyarchaeia archaeon]|nr:AAA family ATPase [Candidatus Bathyarchaeia archaeon]
MVAILETFYPGGMSFSSYSSDGLFQIREVEDGMIEVLGLSKTSEWMALHRFGESQSNAVEGQNGLFENAQRLRWKMDDDALSISQENGEFKPVNGFPLLPGMWDFYEVNAEQILAYNADNQDVEILVKTANGWDTLYHLSLEKDTRATEWEGVYLESPGELGLGKDVIIKATAWLAKQEIITELGHGLLTDEAVKTGYRTIGGEKTGTSGRDPSPFSQAMHSGAWYVLQEAQKVDVDVMDALKDPFTSKEHDWPVKHKSKTGKKDKSEGLERLVSMPNHPRARVLTTSNLVRKGIAGKGTVNNTPMQSRKRLLEYYWLAPKDEAEMQLEYALAEARDSGKHTDDWDAFKAKLQTDIARLVQIAAQLRLMFAGYNDDQQIAIFHDWNLLDSVYLAQKMDQDAHIAQLFEKGPVFPVGKNLKRPPSPRVIKAIITHLVRYEQDYKNRKRDIVTLYYNFFGERDKNTYPGAARMLDGWATDVSGIPGVEFDEDTSFKVDGKELVIQPKAAADGNMYWDTVRVPLHSKASIRRTGKIPDSIQDWIKIPENRIRLYWSLQNYELSGHRFFVGKPGSGKSTLARALHNLLDGPGPLKIQLTKQTLEEHLTFSRGLNELDTVWFPEIIPMAMYEDEEGRLLTIEEASQGEEDTTSIVNRVLGERALKDPRIGGRSRKALKGFSATLTSNLPKDSPSVRELEDDILDRVMTIFFPTLPPDQAAVYLMEAGQRTIRFPKRISVQINPHLVGEPLLDSAGNVQHYADGEVKYTGIIGVAQEINHRLVTDPNFLPREREVSYRNMQAFVKEVVLHFDEEMARGQYTPQEILIRFFRRTFILEGEPKKRMKYERNILDVFKTLKLYNPDAGKPDPNNPGHVIPDAVEEFLQGEGVIVQQLGVVQEPSSGNERVDRMLRFLEQNTLQVSVVRTLGQVSEVVTEALNKCQEGAPKEQAARLRILREVVDILRVVTQHRFEPKPGQPAYSSESQTRLGVVIEQIGKGLIVDRNFPEEFLKAEETGLGARLKEIAEKGVGFEQSKNSELDKILFTHAILPNMTVDNQAVIKIVQANWWGKEKELERIAKILSDADAVAFAPAIKSITARIAQLKTQTAGLRTPRMSTQEAMEQLRQNRLRAELRKKGKSDSAMLTEEEFDRRERELLERLIPLLTALEGPKVVSQPPDRDSSKKEYEVLLDKIREEMKSASLGGVLILGETMAKILIDQVRQGLMTIEELKEKIKSPSGEHEKNARTIALGVLWAQQVKAGTFDKKQSEGFDDSRVLAEALAREGLLDQASRLDRVVFFWYRAQKAIRQGAGPDVETELKNLVKMIQENAGLESLTAAFLYWDLIGHMKAEDQPRWAVPSDEVSQVLTAKRRDESAIAAKNLSDAEDYFLRSACRLADITGLASVYMNFGLDREANKRELEKKLADPRWEVRAAALMALTWLAQGGDHSILEAAEKIPVSPTSPAGAAKLKQDLRVMAFEISQRLNTVSDLNQSILLIAALTNIYIQQMRLGLCSPDDIEALYSEKAGAWNRIAIIMALGIYQGVEAPMTPDRLEALRKIMQADYKGTAGSPAAVIALAMQDSEDRPSRIKPWLLHLFDAIRFWKNARDAIARDEVPDFNPLFTLMRDPKSDVAAAAIFVFWDLRQRLIEKGIYVDVPAEISNLAEAKSNLITVTGHSTAELEGRPAELPAINALAVHYLTAVKKGEMTEEELKAKMTASQLNVATAAFIALTWLAQGGDHSILEAAEKIPVSP